MLHQRRVPARLPGRRQRTARRRLAAGADTGTAPRQYRIGCRHPTRRHGRGGRNRRRGQRGDRRRRAARRGGGKSGPLHSHPRRRRGAMSEAAPSVNEQSRDEHRVSSPNIDSDRPEPVYPLAIARSPGSLRLKRCIDLCLAALALVVLSPLLALIAIIIRLDSPGPAFFRKVRIGIGGRRFTMWKFRSMVHEAADDRHRDLVLPLVRGCASDEAEHAGPGRRIYKLTDDPRITRVGRRLRKASLDELPQLFNVLRGDMSLVGPRPPITYEYEAYDAWQLERLGMPQGMTGLWQVSGRNRLSYRRMHDLDIEYVRNWSLWLDLKILLRTLRAVFVDAEPRA